MAMHPYAEGNISAAQREVARLIEVLNKAIRSDAPGVFGQIGIARAHALKAQAQLKDAVTLDEMANEGGEE